MALWFPLLPACRSCAWLLLRSAVLTRCCSVVPSFCQAEVHKAEAAAAKKELEKFKDVMSGVRAASRDFNASGLGRTGVISGTRRSAASPVHLEEVAPRRVPSAELETSCTYFPGVLAHLKDCRLSRALRSGPRGTGKRMRGA